jgi:hypothetical protein
VTTLSLLAPVRALRDAEVWPRPLQRPIRVWHGSATATSAIAVTTTG